MTSIKPRLELGTLCTLHDALCMVVGTWRWRRDGLGMQYCFKNDPVKADTTHAGYALLQVGGEAQVIQAWWYELDLGALKQCRSAVKHGMMDT